MIRLPTDQDRVMVIGATGEGKTVGALWLLSYAPFHRMPYIIIDYKRDSMIQQVQEVGATVLYDNRIRESAFPSPPTEPGLYIMRPDPEEKEQMNAFLLQVWRNGYTGLFCDEAFIIPQKRPFKAYDNILTSGRSLRIPVIMLYQRPVDMSQYATSQAEYWMAYNLRKPSDIDIANEYIGETEGPNGERIDASFHLPRFYWLWYDVVNDDLHVMRPVPRPEKVIETFRARLIPPEAPKTEEETQEVEPKARFHLV
jgi:hypothetical protein